MGIACMLLGMAPSLSGEDYTCTSTSKVSHIHEVPPCSGTQLNTKLPALHPPGGANRVSPCGSQHCAELPMEHLLFGTNHVLAQIACCDQLLAYLGRYAPAAEEAATSAVSQSVEAPEGMKVVKKKGAEEELDSWYGGLGGAKGGKAKGGKKGRAGPATSAKPKDTRINFSPEIYQGFSKVKVSLACRVALQLNKVEPGL